MGDFTGPSRVTSLAEAFARQAASHPDRWALCTDGGRRWSYDALARTAGALSEALAHLGVAPERRVAVAGGRTAETIIAMLGVLGAGGAYCVIDPQLPVARRRRMLGDLEPTAIVIADEALAWTEDTGYPVARLSTDFARGASAHSVVLDGSALAYVIFTSGSTGRPKGVMVEHRSVLNMLDSYDRLAPSVDGFSGALVSPTSFDVSVWEIFSVLSRGGTLHVPAAHRLASGADLWTFFCDEDIDSGYIPPGLLPSLVAEAERRRGALRRALVGVEPISQDLLQRLRNASPGIRIVNGYGPTETTVTATLHLVADMTDPGGRVPIGRPVAGSRIELVTANLTPVAPGETGEIVVYGDCLARGYLRPEERDGFIEIGGLRAYRTGDRARLRADGTLEFAGRDDGQVKIAGFRVEIGDVEAAINRMSGVSRGVVFTAGDPETRRLVAAIETAEHITPEHVRDHLNLELPSHAIPSRIMTMRRLPLTTNGKVDVKALAAVARLRSLGGAAYAEPKNDWQLECAGAWARTLGVATVGIDDDFHELGGRSLDAVRIAASLNERGYAVAAQAILQARSIRFLEPPAPSREAIPPAAPGAYRATRAQQGLWAWREMHPHSAATTVVHAMAFEGRIDAGRVERAMRRAITKHEALRTTFAFRDGRLEQHVAPAVDWTLATVAIQADADVDNEIQASLCRRFDACTSPWSAKLLIGAQKSALVFAADHLIFDGESADVLQRDLARGYDDADLEPTPGPAALEAHLSTPREHVELLRAWWRDTLEGFVDRAVLPEPLTRGSSKEPPQRIHSTLDASIRASVESLARASGATPFVVILAAFKAFLRQRGEQPDNTVAVAVSRRHAAGASAAVGNFVTLVPVHDAVPSTECASRSFLSYLAEIADRFQQAVERSTLPFEDIVAELPRSPDGSAAGLARTVLAQRMPVVTSVTSDGLRISAWPELPDNAIHDLAVFLTEDAGDGSAQLEWVCCSTTPEGALSLMAEAFTRFVSAAVSAPDKPLAALPAIGDSEARCIEAHATPLAAADGVNTETLVSLFDEQVARRPEAIAIDDPAGLVSYGQLSMRARTIGQALGYSAGRDPVVVVLTKSADLLAAMIAAIQMGAPYLPLDPEHARTRLPDLARRANVRLCVTSSCHAQAMRLPDDCRVVLVDDLLDAAAPHATATNRLRVLPDDLAYVMPTSGSTGTAKLVGVPHRAVVRLVYQNDSIPLDDSDRTMLIANSSFDAATFEVWGALANGGRVIVPRSDELRDPGTLASAIERTQVTAGFFTTTLFERLLDHLASLRHMRHVIVGGEAVPPRLFEAASRTLRREALINGYGPTENTTFSCCFRLDREPASLRSVPIGRPIACSGAIVVNATLQPVPPGYAGEIVVTGDGLAIGYVDDSDLTRQRFVTIPSLGIRGYRTGDLGRLLPEGIFEYLGRIDRQLKVRGFRIEPGEVEAALAEHPGVRRSVVYADELGGVRSLLAAVEANSVDEAGLRAWLTPRLPDFLVPVRLYVVERMPMTPNGKLDVAALRQLPVSTAQRDDDTPRTELERFIANTMASLLSRPAVALDDDLFDLGANSMIALALAERLAEHLGRPVQGHIVYSGRTVRSLAQRLAMDTSGPETSAARRARERAQRIRRSISG